MTRTVSKHWRVYANGAEICNYTRVVGPLVWAHDGANLTTMCDSVIGGLPNSVTITPTAINGVMDNDAAGLRVLAQAGTGGFDMMIPIGIQAPPAQGNPVFCCRVNQASYTATDDGGAVTVNINMPNGDAADLMSYPIPWGVLLRPLTATTGANSSAGVDGAAATTAGGYMMYQVTAGNGTATISIDDSADDITYGALSGMTTGLIDCSNPTAGIVEIGKTATIKRYTRWQIALGSATSVTFALALVRGR